MSASSQTQSQSETNLGLLSTYTSVDSRYDELRDASGSVRPHWQYLVDAFDEMGPAQRQQRQAELRRLLLESGIAYNVYRDSGAQTRRWPLDLLPFVISGQEWRKIEAGIAQRAELLSLIYADLYGPQTLIRGGLLPAQVVYGHPGFLLPCLSIPQSADLALSVYGADIGRAPDGQWCVTGDRTQAPSGIGYALASRTAMARMLPSVFRDANVQPVLPFLRDLRNRLMHLADNEPDHIAILSPGPANETYPEQAYLARQLGLPLVEGDDLEVHRGRCYFNEHDADSGDGGDRQRLSVLLRRMDDDYCDPLELNRSSMLGTAGFTQAIRSRNLSTANPLGAGVLENPALMAFLPRLCRGLLGQDLLLPSVESFWCGERESLAAVETRFDDMIIRRFRASATHPPVVVSNLSAVERQTLLRQVRARPDAYAAQRAGTHSFAPVYANDGILARPVELRTFAVASQGGFRVMSGGIARVGRHADSTRFSTQLGGTSKDIWVLASEPVGYSQTEFSASPEWLSASLPAYALRPATITQPHLADNLIWLGRYLVRAMQLNRMLNFVITRLIDAADACDPDGRPQVDPLTRLVLRAITWQSTMFPGFTGDQGQHALDAPLEELLRVLSGNEFGGMQHDLRAIAGCAVELQALFAADANDAASAFAGIVLPSDPATTSLQDIQVILSQLSVSIPALLGLLMNTLPTDGPRALLETGMALELGLATNRLVRSMMVGTDAPAIAQRGADTLSDEAAQATLLLSASPPPQSPLGDNTASVLSELIASGRNPRSVRYQVVRLQQLTPRLKRPKVQNDSDGETIPLTQQPSGTGQRIQEALTEQLAKLDALPLDAMARAGEVGGELDQCLERLDSDLRNTANQVIERLTRHRRAPATQMPPPPLPESGPEAGRGAAQ